MTDLATPGGTLADLLTSFGVTAVTAVDDGDRDSTLDSEVEAGKIERGEVAIADLLRLPGVDELLVERGVTPDDETQVRGLLAESLRNGEFSLGPPDNGAGTASAFAALRALLDEAGIPFNVVHFDDWAGPDGVDPSTLMLFDFRHGLDEAGVPLALAYVQAHGPDARAAILSQEVGAEQDLWRQHVAAADSDLACQVVWIPKASLTTQPSAVVEGLAVALSAPLLRDLRERGLAALRTALDETEAVASDLNPYELHHLTIVSAVGDGGFEPEALITRFARRSLPIAMASMQLEAPIHTSIRRLREVRDASSSSSEASGALVDLQKDDYYISREHLVGRHQGAQAGDIFAIVSPEIVAASLDAAVEAGTDPMVAEVCDLSQVTLCVLVAQPCDLAVRKTGTRAATGRWLEALPIEAPGGNDADGWRVGPAVVSNQRIFRLPWLAGSGVSSHRRVTFKRVLSLPMLGVDACVWSVADAAALVAEAAVSDRCSLNWQARHGLETAHVSRIEESCRVADGLPADQAEIAARIRLDAASSDEAIGFQYSSENRSLAWGLVRVGRLRSPYVESLVTTYNDFRRREAFPSPVA